MPCGADTTTAIGDCLLLLVMISLTAKKRCALANDEPPNFITLILFPYNAIKQKTRELFRSRAFFNLCYLNTPANDLHSSTNGGDNDGGKRVHKYSHRTYSASADLFCQ